MAKEIFYISELADFLDRRPNTVRGWERDGLLPESCRSTRDDKGWRYWTRAQAEEIKHWIEATDRRPGKGLSHYKPTPEQIASHIAKTRSPRSD